MTIGKKIKAARKRSKITQARLAELSGTVQANISSIESDGNKTTDPRTLIRIADALDAPEILLHHCDHCPIRKHVFLKFFPELNNIRRDPAVIAARLRKEMAEGADALDRLGERFSDKDFRVQPDYMQVFEREMEQVLDVKRGIEILEFELLLEGLHSQQDLQKVYDNQQQKCIANGHHVPERGEQ